MVLRLCLCVIFLFAGVYANNSTDYCGVLVKTFKTSVDQFLASWIEIIGGTDKDSENPTASQTAMTKRVNELEKQVEKLLNDNENKAIRLRYLESALANLRSDCGSPPSQEGTDVVFVSTPPRTMATYRCKKGFMNIHPDQQNTSLCLSDGSWTMVNVTCVNLSSCWAAPTGRLLYTGTISTTITGKVCQRCDSQTPHNHDQTEDVKFWIPGFDTTQTVTRSANYCRDPDVSGFLWCYTTDGDSRWEKCDVPRCNM